MSPYKLLQEIYINQPWKSMICCILLNRTSRKQVDSVIGYLFRTFEDAVDMAQADPEILSEMLKSLGFQNKRAKTLIRFSKDWISIDWKDPKELYGIGQYAADSYDIFYNNKTDIKPKDGVLVKYIEWKLHQTQKKHCMLTSEN